MARSRSPRVVRGLIAASVATFVALLSHVAAGGAMPGWLGVAVPWVLAAMVCTVLAGRSLSLWRLSIAVAVSQVLFHGLFVLGMVAPGEQAAGHVHGAMVHSAAVSMPSMVGHPDVLMWVGHLVAAVLTIAALHRGEAAVRRLLAIGVELASALRRRLIRATVVLVPASRPTPPASAAPRVLPSLGWFPSAIARRGPPVLRLV